MKTAEYPSTEGTPEADSPFRPGTPTDLARKTTVSELCHAWQESKRQIEEAFAAIIEAQDRLEALFQAGSRNLTVHSHRGGSIDFKNPAEAIDRLKRQVWSVLADRLELRKVLSLKKIAELDAQIEHGDDLPEITFENIMGYLEFNLDNRSQFLQDKIQETYQWLRPEGWQRGRYVTNEKSRRAGVGRKVIISYGCETSYHHQRPCYAVPYSRRDHLRALDQVMHLLDGKPQPEGYNGALHDAMMDQTAGKGTNTFTTAYFRGKCFKNQNLHLEFVRHDLLAKFNLIAAGANLNDITPDALEKQQAEDARQAELAAP